MIIRKKKTKYHKYILEFEYREEIIEKIRQIRANNLKNWKDLTFDWEEKIWCFSKPYVIQLLEDELDAELAEDIKDEVDSQIQQKNRRESHLGKLKTFVEERIKPINPKTKIPLFNFQQEVVGFIEAVGGKALLALDMGTGKTICAIGYAYYKKYKKVLIISPASVKWNWQNEIKKFVGIKATVLTEEKNPTGWEIVGYSNLQKYWDYLRKQEYDLIICDESQMIKNRKAIRTKKTLALLKKSKDVLFLSGTPIMNRPIEIFNIYKFIYPDTDWFEWVRKYCAAKKTMFGWDLNGASNLDELKTEMKWMIRRTKEEVLDELPDKTINIWNTEMTDWGEYNKCVKEFKEWLLENKLNKNAIYAEALTKVNYLKQIVVKQKMKQIKQIIDSFIEGGKKLIVFSQYRFVIDELQAQYDKSVKLTGETPENERQSLVDEFQKGNLDIFFSTIKAGGVGITLTQSDTVLFTDISWTPADWQQGIDRCHRIGQKNNVNAYFLITKKTIEEKVWRMLKRKETMINQIMEGKENVRRVHIKTLIKNL